MRLGSILLVEDSHDNREALAEFLRSEGFVVQEAINGADALSQLSKGFTPDLIITDLMMPSMDGRTLIDKLRKSPMFKHIPVIIISALKVLPNDQSRAIARFRKPLNLKSLLKTIRTLD